MADFNKFLLDLSLQLNLAAMDGSQRARLAKLKAEGTATKDQAIWDPAKPLPDPTDVIYGISSTTSWVELYTLFQQVFRDIDANREDAVEKTPEIEKFLTDSFGVGKTISGFIVSRKVTEKIDPIATDFETYLNKPQVGIFLESNDISFEDKRSLISKIHDGSYKNSPKALKILRSVIVALVNNEADLVTAGLDFNTFINSADLVTVYNNINRPRPPTLTELKRFKLEYKNIVSELVVKEKIRNAFSEYDSDRKISRAIAKGINNSDYKNSTSKNYITPLYSDRKRSFDIAKGKITSWRDDHFGKLESRHKRHLYSTNAKFIVGEIIKNKIQPTDGLSKIVENADKIKSSLQASAPKAATEFDYLSGILKKLSGTKAFAEAAKDGAQMRYIVQEIIKDAVHNGKKNEAKTALETLSVIRYGNLTSSIRTDLEKANWTFFSDKSLSWNKNESLQFLSNATDKTIKAFTFTMFEIGNFAKNKLVREKGLKFKNGTKRIKEAQKSPDYLSKKADFEELFAFWDFLNTGNETSDFNPLISHKNQQSKFNPLLAFTNFESTHSIGK